MVNVSLDDTFEGCTDTFGAGLSSRHEHVVGHQRGRDTIDAVDLTGVSDMLNFVLGGRDVTLALVPRVLMDDAVIVLVGWLWLGHGLGVWVGRMQVGVEVGGFGSGRQVVVRRSGRWARRLMMPVWLRWFISEETIVSHLRRSVLGRGDGGQSGDGKECSHILSFFARSLFV